MTGRRSSSGRKDATERIRELVSLLGSLSKTGDTVTLDAISSRLGISHEDAKALMDIVCQASGEESSGLLISANDDLTEYTLQYPEVRGRPIRLTSAETVAVVHALDRAGIDDGDPLRSRLNEAFSSPEIQEDMVRKSLAENRAFPAQDVGETLFCCARAQADRREIVFSYRGIKDERPHTRRAMVMQLFASHDIWYVQALDLNLHQERTFRIDRMSGITIGNTAEPQTTLSKDSSNTRMIRITFSSEDCLTALEWNELRVLHRSEGCITCEIPYYGPQSLWLVRRIAACGDSIRVEDQELAAAVREYVTQLLKTTC